MGCRCSIYGNYVEANVIEPIPGTKNSLTEGETLSAGERLVSASGEFSLEINEHNDVVLSRM